MSIDEMHGELQVLGNSLKETGASKTALATLQKLASYYEHQQNQLKGFEKDPTMLQENLAIIEGWIREIRQLMDALNNLTTSTM